MSCLCKTDRSFRVVLRKLVTGTPLVDMNEIARHIRETGPHEASNLAGLIRVAYRDVAERFNLTDQNCPKHPSNCSINWVKKDMNRGVSYYCLELDEKTIGCTAFEKAKPEEGYLERLAVLPQYRNNGFGKALIRHVFDVASAAGVHRIGIGIISEQIELKKWYEKMGFVEQEVKTFSHLPFKVSLLAYTL